MKRKDAVLIVLTRYNKIKAEKETYIKYGVLHNFAEGKLNSLKWILQNIYGFEYDDKRF